MAALSVLFIPTSLSYALIFLIKFAVLYPVGGFSLLSICRRPSASSYYNLQPPGGLLQHPRGRKSKDTATIRLAAHNNLHQKDFLDQIQVFDGVFDPDVCLELHYLAVEHADRSGEGSSVFSWSPTKTTSDQEQELTPLEQALCSCIEQLYASNGERHASAANKHDTADWVVEYWSREEFMNMDAHSDIDERQLLDEGTLECPKYGHVLYLDVHPSIRGPTCVFSQMGGWHSSIANNNSNDNISDNDDEEKEANIPSTSLVTVPAVPGRVLRFPGSAMHAVPKPATLWFQSQEEQSETLAKDEEEDDDDDDDDDSMIERSVILFNVWLHEGPRGVTVDYVSKGGMPDGIQLVVGDDEKTLEAVEDDGNSFAKREKAQRIAQWEDEYGVDCEDLWCEPRTDWQESAILSHEEKANSNSMLLTVPLMGKQARRLYPAKHVKLSAPVDLQSALEDDSHPQHFLLHE